MNPVWFFISYFNNIFPHLPSNLLCLNFPTTILYAFLITSMLPKKEHVIHGGSYNSKNNMAICVTISLLYFFILFSLPLGTHFRTGEGNKRISNWNLQIISKKLTAIFKWEQCIVSLCISTNSMLLKLRSPCYLTLHKNSKLGAPM